MWDSGLEFFFRGVCSDTAQCYALHVFSLCSSTPLSIIKTLRATGRILRFCRVKDSRKAAVRLRPEMLISISVPLNVTNTFLDRLVSCIFCLLFYVKLPTSYDQRTSRENNNNWGTVFSCFHCGKQSLVHSPHRKKNSAKNQIIALFAEMRDSPPPILPIMNKSPQKNNCKWWLSRRKRSRSRFTTLHCL